jgi:hypothetical protein
MIEQEPHISTDIHTARYGDVLYDVGVLNQYAEQLPLSTAPLAEFAELVSAGQYYWEDKNGAKLGPFEILQDWDEAQQNPAWAEHIEKIRNADLSAPLWVAPGGQVIDGMHRLTKYFVNSIPEVHYKKFDELPKEAVVNT